MKINLKIFAQWGQLLDGLATIVLSARIDTKLCVCHFKTIPGHFSANYYKIFHKTEVQTNILRCLTCLNLKWMKSCNKNHKKSCSGSKITEGWKVILLRFKITLNQNPRKSVMYYEFSEEVFLDWHFFFQEQNFFVQRTTFV